MRFHMRDVRRELVLRRAVHSRLAADKNDGEPDIRKAADNLMHPRRYTSADVRISTLQQQADISDRFFRRDCLANVRFPKNCFYLFHQALTIASSLPFSPPCRSMDK